MQEYCKGIFLLQGIFPTQGWDPSSPALADRFFTAELPGEPQEEGGRTLTLTQPAQDSQHGRVPPLRHHWKRQQAALSLTGLSRHSQFQPSRNTASSRSCLTRV